MSDIKEEIKYLEAHIEKLEKELKFAKKLLVSWKGEPLPEATKSKSGRVKAKVRGKV